MSDKIPPRIEITAMLEVVAPIHIGDGGTRVLGFKKGEVPPSSSNDDKTPTVATVVRDGNDKPYLPSTTLKGFLRAIGEEIQQAATGQADDTLTDKLFGRIKTSDPGADAPMGTMGALIVRGAQMQKEGPTHGLPFCPNPPDANGKVALSEVDKGRPPGTFIAARTRIDPASGTAADSALFHAEKVARGTTFELRLLLAPRQDADTDTLFDRLAKILAGLSTNAGKPIGKGAAENSGRVRWVADADLKVAVKRLDTNGAWVEDTGASKSFNVRLKTAKPPAEASPVFSQTLTLVCPGPYIVIDASRRAKRRATNQPGSKVQIEPQSDGANPLVDPAGVAGALRAVAEWLEAVERLRAGEDASVDAVTVQTRDDVKTLSRTERLFGATGFRGLLALRVDDVSSEESQDFTSVKLDRMSGGPIDGALFATRTFINTKLILTVSLRDRGDGDESPHLRPTADDKSFVEALVARIAKDGLKLGHGTNKGFGWFSATNGGRRGA